MSYDDDVDEILADFSDKERELLVKRFGIDLRKPREMLQGGGVKLDKQEPIFSVRLFTFVFVAMSTTMTY